MEDETPAVPMHRVRVALWAGAALGGALFGALLLMTHAVPRALPWAPTLVVVAGLYVAANRSQYARPASAGSLQYSPSTPFLLAGAVLLPPLPLLFLAVFSAPLRSTYRWQNITLRLATICAASLAFWTVHGSGSQLVTRESAPGDAAALLCAMAAFELAQLLILNGSIWLSTGISLARQSATWGAEYLAGELWELSAGAAAAALALVAPVLLVPASGLLVLIFRQTQYFQAIHDRDRDGKTGLLNMRAFTRLADSELSSARRHGYPLAFLMLDVDHLRAINTAHGHLGGDTAIALVAKVLTEHLRDEDLAARFGGEEFAVVLPHTDLAAAAEAAERIRTAIESSEQRVGPGRLCVTVSVGVSRFCPDDTLDDLLVSADRALYEAKDDGRNLVRLAARAAIDS